MELAPGQQLGPYEIIGPLGSGGMGTVYRARDTRLGRDVAIKVSSGRFSERFEREARVIAQLNHPSICTLHDIGPDYLVMELVEGETLAERVSAGPMPAHEVVHIAEQIAEALDVAHDRGVVHRDLKPGNVMIRPDGRVKVLDFGLAKMGGTPSVSSDESPTVMLDDTRAGVILGTASYMSPEQAMGKSVDKRADVYAFGAVVYEMATGERLHRGGTTTEVLASVLKEEPRWDRVPPQFRKLLRRCLAKDPQQRLKHVGDVMALAEEGTVDSGPMPAVSTAASRRGWLWPAAAVLLLAAAGAAWWAVGRGPQKVEVLRFQILEDGKYKLQNASPAVSPDGKWVAFQAPGTDGLSHIWLRALDSLESRPIPGTESPNLLQSPPFWSHDSKAIVFAINPAPFAAGHLKRVDISGGTPQVICEVRAGVSGVAWSPEGVIVFVDSARGFLQQVPATGGAPEPVTSLRGDDRFHMMPQFLPDGRTFLYQRATRSTQVDGIYVGSLDKTPAEQSTSPILLTNRQAFYSPAGEDHLVFLREQTLFAQPFDVSTHTLTGQPVAVVDGVSSFAPALSGRFSVSTNGVLAYNAGPVTIGQLAVTERGSGQMLQFLTEQSSLNQAEVSPDAKRVATVRVDPASGTTNIWVTDLATKNSTKVTYGSGRNSNPVWSPDSQSIVFASNRQGVLDLYLKKADGSGEERLILKTEQDKLPTSWSPNGFLMYHGVNAGAPDLDLGVLPHPEGGITQPVPYLRTQAAEFEGRFSPDGKWVAYTSTESGKREVYIRPFDPQHPEASATGGRWLLSRGDGFAGRWTKDGRELLYVSGAGRIVAQAVDPAKPYEVKGPVEDVAEATLGGYSVSPDGSKIIRVVVPTGEVPGQLVVVKNWHAALRK